jgi:poly(A) polymerase
MLKDAAISIIETLRSRGFQAYLVGGCVRDILLSREPADYDVTTDATPEQVMRVFPQTYAVGAQFGVVLVAVKDGVPPQAGPSTHPHAIEVATFRSDGIYSDGRHPDEVKYSKSPQEDVQRRDFTINGLLLDPVKDEVLDFVGGRADLAANVIRTIGDAQRRFSEDKLRLLRAVRFAARFGYRIDGETFEAIRELAPQITQVSHERVRDELTKMLTEGRAGRAFELLDQTGLLKQVLPEISAMKGVEQPPQFHPEGDVFVHTMIMLGMLPANCSRTLAWGTLLHDVGKPPTFRVGEDRIRFDGHVEVGVKMAEEICHRLRMSNDDSEQICALVNNHMRFGDALKMKESTLKRFLRLPQFDEHLALHRIDCLGSHGKLEIHDFLRDKLDNTPEAEIRPAPLINGYDLIKLGLKPGPPFADILSTVEDAQLEGKLHTRDEAITFVTQLLLSNPQLKQ